MSGVRFRNINGQNRGASGNGRRKHLMEEEVRRLLVRDADMRDRLLIQMGLSLGCRVSEVVSIKLRNINGRVVRIWDEKKDEYRHCVLDSGTAALLEGYLRDHYTVPRGYNRSHRRLFYISAKTVNRVVKRAFADVGIPEDVPHRWHTLRHTYIRMMLDRLKDRAIQFICEQTGDSPVTIIRHYAVPSLDERLEVADILAETDRGPDEGATR